MIYEHEIPVRSDPAQQYLAFGRSSWDSQTPVVKAGWLDRNGHRSRAGGEIQQDALLQMVEEAVRLGFISPKAALEAVAAGMA